MTNSRIIFLFSLIFFLILKITATRYWVLTKVSLLGSVINLLLSSHISKQAWKANTWGPKLWCTQQFTACHWPRNRMGEKKTRELWFHSFFSPSVTPQTKKSEQSFPSRWHLKGPHLIFKGCALGGCLHPCAHTLGRDQGLGTRCWWQRMPGCRQAPGWWGCLAGASRPACRALSEPKHRRIHCFQQGRRLAQRGIWRHGRVLNAPRKPAAAAPYGH